MNDASRPEPLSDDERDELLSADLDGELAAAAADFGLDLEAARRRIAATPGADARRRELAAAQALGAQTNRVDEPVLARLRAKAVQAGNEAHAVRARTRRRRVARGAAIAAAAAVLLSVAIVAALVRSNPRHTTSSSAAAPVSTPSSQAIAPAPSPNDAASGSYADVQSLMTAVSDSVRRDSLAANGTYQPTAGAASRSAARGRCAPEFDRLGGTGEPVVDSNALVEGRPVYVRAYVQAHATLVIVLSRDCRLLARRADTH